MEEAFRTPREVGQTFRPDATEAFARLTTSVPGSCIACDTPDVLEVGGRVDEGTQVSADGPQENAERIGRKTDLVPAVVSPQLSSKSIPRPNASKQA